MRISCVCVCVWVGGCARARACVCACVRTRVRAQTHTHTQHQVVRAHDTVEAVNELVRLGATCSRWLIFCSVLPLEYWEYCCINPLSS